MKHFNATKIQALALALCAFSADHMFAGKPGGGGTPGGSSNVGVVTIDQDKAAAGGVTPGDAPGFPATISEPGMYRLDSNLTVPDTSTTVIEVTSNNVTIDLNGFSILGPNVCLTSTSCTVTNGTGYGIKSTATNVAVFGGTVNGMGGPGVKVGRNGRVERMHLTSNGGGAIGVGQDSLVSDCIVDLNYGWAVWAGNGSLVLRNVLANNLNGGYFNEPEPGRVSIGLNVFRYNFYNAFIGNPIQLQPNTCFGNGCL